MIKTFNKIQSGREWFKFGEKLFSNSVIVLDDLNI